MSVYKKLQEARILLQNTKLNKSGKNKFAGFSYFELSDFIPQVTDVANTSKVVDLIAAHDLVLVFHESATNKVSEIVTRKYYESQSVMIIIGPEGGITNEEIELFKSAGAKVALMGRPILRSAHAGLAAMSAVNALIKVW
jgi:16S rRNA (uracil1498-N3)-methyltransferase